MTCDLNRIFSDIAVRLPDDTPKQEPFVFHAGSVPEPPADLSTDQILFRKLHHDYNGWYRVDGLWMYMNSRTCRELGVFLLACAFHGPAEDTILTLSHPSSDIRRIMIPRGRLTLADLPPGLSWVPFALRYYAQETDKHPWMYDCDARGLPRLALTNKEDCVGPGDEEWKGRDSIKIYAAAEGTMALAELLLNAGAPSNEVREYALEGDAGFRGVAPMSAELRIFLPGDFGWPWQTEDLSQVRGPW